MKTLNYLNEKCQRIHLGSLLAFYIVFAFSTGTFAQSAKPDLSGKWILNREKSQLREVNYAHTLSVEQNDNVISMYLIHKALDGKDSVTHSFTYNVDGVRFYDADDSYEEETITTWYENGRGFYKYNYYVDDLYEVYELTVTDFELSEDLKTLTKTVNLDYFVTEILVYEKAGK